MQEPIAARIYGDSIMKGTIIDAQSLRYRATIAEYLEPLQQRFHLAAQNRARFGATIERGLQIIRHDLQTEPNLRCDIALIEFGGNDCNFNWSEVAASPDTEHLPLTPRDRFLATYRSIVQTLREKGIRPALMTLPPIDASRYFAFIGKAGNNLHNILHWLGDVQRIYRFHESYSNAVAKLAREEKCDLVDVRAYFLDQPNYKELIGIDGLHPTREGYRLVSQACADYLAATL